MPSRLLDTLLDVLVPTCCLSCRAWQPVDPLGLCRRCRSSLAPTDRRRCRTCAHIFPAVPRPGRILRCGQCAVRPPGFTELMTLYAYQPPLDSVVKAMKFSRRPYLARLLADQMWDRWAERLSGVHMVVPVPLPWIRHRIRGYNQAEVLARRLAYRLDAPTAQPLRRRSSSPQSREPDLASRRRNARRSIHLNTHRTWLKAVQPITRLPDRVLLVDDVVTSGATLERCARLLRRLGAEQVICAAVAHRPAIGGLGGEVGTRRPWNVSRNRSVDSR